ncbi:MAG: hypothetical protein IKN15_06120 [Bacteroidaceae bacterium]|jgi:hypothetical protein|nr:hypothetical protein [Bacteroidaceae bacterium]
MKRKLSTILTVVLFLFCASLVKAQTHVPLEPEIVVNQGSEQGDHPKAPVQIPTVYYEDYVLTFDSSCIGCTIELVQDDEVVFTGVVNANGEVEIPDTLVGLIELRIYRGGTSFVGEFEP